MKRQSKLKMYRHIEKWQKSGQTQKGYSERHGFSRDVFRYWHKKYKTEKSEQIASVKPTIKSSSAFVALEAPKETARVAAVRSNKEQELQRDQSKSVLRVHIEYPNGISVNIEQAADVQSAIQLGVLLGLRTVENKSIISERF